jgi:hypothetical protein
VVSNYPANLGNKTFDGICGGKFAGIQKARSYAEEETHRSQAALDVSHPEIQYLPGSLIEAQYADPPDDRPPDVSVPR